MRVSNFWEGFDHFDANPNSRPWSDFLFQGLHGSSLHVGSAFGHSRRPYDLLFSGENLKEFRHDGNHFVFKDQLTGKTGKAKWFVGIPECPHPQALHLPLYFCYWAEYRHRHGKASPEPLPKQFGLSVTIGNFVNGDLTRKRVALAHQLSHFMPVHANRALQKDAPTDSKVLYHDVPEKLDFISRFSHHLCFENSTKPGYLTEKIFDPLYVGAVPVYQGDPMADKWISREGFIDCLNLDAAGIAQEIHASKALGIFVSEKRELLSTTPFEEMRDRVASFNARLLDSMGPIRRKPQGTLSKSMESLRRMIQRF